jgi:hypothetical protein
MLRPYKKNTIARGFTRAAVKTTWLEHEQLRNWRSGSI